MSSTTSSTADRLDDLGIGILASPYIAHGVAGLAGKSPRLAPVAAAAKAYETAFHSNPAGELVGLGLVAPGIVNPLAKQVDKLMPEKTAAAAGRNAALARLGLL